MPTKTRAVTPTATTAARSLAFLLNVDDASRASLAVLLAAADELEQNSRFAARVRATYDQLPTKAPRGSGSTGGSRTSAKTDAAKILASTLKPIRFVEDREINPAAPLDPYFLLEVYGTHQLRDALDLFPLTKLKEAADAVTERHPGTKPKNRSSKSALIDYITHHLTDPDIPAQ